MTTEYSLTFLKIIGSFRKSRNHDPPRELGPPIQRASFGLPTARADATMQVEAGRSEGLCRSERQSGHPLAFLPAYVTVSENRPLLFRIML
jgi:hypothetical protein